MVHNIIVFAFLAIAVFQMFYGGNVDVWSNLIFAFLIILNNKIEKIDKAINKHQD